VGCELEFKWLKIGSAEVLCDHVNCPSSLVIRGEILDRQDEYQIHKEGFTFMELTISRYINWYIPSSEKKSYIQIFVYTSIYLRFVSPCIIVQFK